MQHLNVVKNAVALIQVPPIEEREPLSRRDMDSLAAANSLTQLRYTELTLTPHLAGRLLRANAINRAIRWPRVQLWADAIRRHEWALNGESLKIAWDGRLVDGQHRCCAVIVADSAIPTSLTMNLDPACFDTIDIGGIRTPGDILSVMQEAHPELLGAALRWVWKYEHGRLLATNQGANPTRPQLRQTLEKHPQIRESIPLATVAFRRIPKSIAVFLHYLFSRTGASPEDVARFFEMLGKGVGFTSERHPVCVLLNTLPRLHKDRPAILYFTMRAWDLYRQGKQITTFQVSRWDRAKTVWPKL